MTHSATANAEGAINLVESVGTDRPLEPGELVALLAYLNVAATEANNAFVISENPSVTVRALDGTP